MESMRFLTRVPDQSIVVSDEPDPWRMPVATRDSEGSYAMAYLPWGGNVELAFSGSRARWFDPRTGEWLSAEHSANGWSSPSEGEGRDWVLVLDGG